MAPGRGPERFRVPGPICWTRDPYLERNIAFVAEAWELARARDVETAITSQTGDEFLALIRSLVGGLLMAADLMEELNAGGASALGVGVTGLPGTLVGAGTGYALSLRFLEGLEAGFLLSELAPYLEVVDRAFARGIAEAWESAGSSFRIHAAALIMADAVGIFFSLLLQGLIAFLAKEMGGRARGRLRVALAEQKETKLLRASVGLETWILIQYDRLIERFRADALFQGQGSSQVANASTSGVIAPRIQPNPLLPDISNDFRFEETVRDGKTYKIGSGRLGVPGRVRTHRNQNAQRGVSEGSGDDAGHLIGNRFGAPGGPENLSLQNWVANRYGTYKGLEDAWAEALKTGSEIEVTVTDITRPNEDRPFMREVRWTEIEADGKRLAQNLTFANMHTPKSRKAQDIAPTNPSGEMGKVIEVDFTKND
ncbi:DNA/RNA non-specific endonuclease [Singulisphaera sp. GP187]|uniref:DNA/RNA non-specific endonuclease n=1 Tax=Singulisphaera sp. GP187 TaxID=1882752 RepID=UPI0020B120A9|nr:DNA/RNA non-specific endonuclease [Singulisphaera sp. GP187]